MPKKLYSDHVIDLVIEQLKMRACDPWPDELWPQANRVLSQIARELQDKGLRGEITAQAWAKFQRTNKPRKP